MEAICKPTKRWPAERTESLVYALAGMQTNADAGRVVECMTVGENMGALQGWQTDLSGQRGRLTMTACRRVKVLLPTEVPKALATSLAPARSKG